MNENRGKSGSILNAIKKSTFILTDAESMVNKIIFTFFNVLSISRKSS